jgi:hypothetical protein
MPNIFVFQKSYIYFTLKCIREPIHVHFNEGKPADDGKSAKIWILSDGSLEIAKMGIYDSKHLSERFYTLLDFLKTNLENAKDEWIKRTGSIEYIDCINK